MMELRQALALVGVVVAAAATIATSPKRWTLTDTKAATLVLDDDSPKRSVHVTVLATHPAQSRISAAHTWASSSSRAEVRFTGKSDDGVQTFDSVAAPMSIEGGAVATQTVLTHSLDCSPPCSRGYTLSFERTRGAGERVEIEWKVTAQSRELGDQPPGASVSVRVDPAPPP
jgi:hypothetical protein